MASAGAASAQGRGLEVRPPELLRLAASESAPVEGTLWLANREPSKLEWRASANPDWLRLSAYSGTLRLGERAELM